MATVVQHEHEHGFAFVSVNNSGKPQPTDRKTIRSHCMRGKNRTIGLGPRAPRRVSPSSTLSSRSRSSLHLSEGLAEGSSGSTFGFEVSGPESYSRSPALVNSSIPGLGNKDCHDETGINLQLSQYNSGANQGENENHHAFTQLEQQTLTKIYTPSTLSLLHFAFEVTTDDKAFLFDFLNAFTSTMYPTTAFTAYNIATCPWANWTFTDPSYLQCIFFMACVLRDLSQSQCQYATHPEGKLKSITAPTYGALRNTIMHLNKRLSHPDSSIALADSTIAVVVILTMFCCMMGDHEGAKAHVAGLKMLVFLRGGIQGFGGNEKLIIKLSRVDLVYALNSGMQGVFCARPINAEYGPGLQGPGLGLNSFSPSTEMLYGVVDSRLLPMFKEMQHYSTLINSAHVTRQRRTIEEYHSVVCSFQYRLLQLQGSLSDGLSECLRLAMLAFLITTFQFPGTRAQYPYLANCLKRACCEVMRNDRACHTTDIMGWVIIVGAISVFDVNVEEDWMKTMWKSHGDVVDWCTMREKVKSIMWVDVLQDGPGQIAFQNLNELCL